MGDPRGDGLTKQRHDFRWRGTGRQIPVPAGTTERFAADAIKGATLSEVHDPREAALGAHALYTDVWTSMGQEAEREKRLKDFAGFCLDQELLELGDEEKCATLRTVDVTGSVRSHRVNQWLGSARQFFAPGPGTPL